MRIVLLAVISLAAVAAVVASLTFRRNDEAAQAGHAPRAPSTEAPSASEALSNEPLPDEPSLEERCRRRAAEMRNRIGRECSTFTHRPFVLAGDLSEGALRRWCERTIVPAAAAMANTYFDTPPDEVITVLLFSNRKAYDHFARKLYNDTDVSVYGYYKPSSRTLVMNVGLGGGTLVHELTHALIAFDFPEVPVWFNEGLASLHEQCRYREGDDGLWIEGLENWRLPMLQDAIRDGRAPPVRDMLRDANFRQRAGVNYAAARYLCMYMQQRGVLQEFYRQFRRRQGADPRGEQALLRVFPDTSWRRLDAGFREWVMGLSLTL